MWAGSVLSRVGFLGYTMVPIFQKQRNRCWWQRVWPRLECQGARQWEATAVAQTYPQPPQSQTHQPNLTLTGCACALVQQAVQLGQRLVAQHLVQFAAHTHHPQGRDCQGHAQACHALGITHARVLPEPSAAFEHFEALLAPGTQAVPGDLAGPWRQVGQHTPSLGVVCAPTGSQSTRQSRTWCFERGSFALPARTNHRHQLGQAVEASATGWAKCGMGVDTQERMPAQAYNPTKQ